MKSMIPDWLPKLFVKAEGSVREATTKKFSDFNKITDTEGMEVVGIKGGANVRADFPVAGEAGEVTTSMVGLEPDDALRNTKGQFMPTKELPELSNQKDANRYIASELQRLDQEIEGIEAGGGDVDLSDYATIEFVEETELQVLNAAIKVAADGDKVLQEQIDELEAPDLTGYATEDYVDESIANIEFPEGVDLTGYATEEWVTGQIDAIDFPETDLDGYATETYVDDAIAAIPETDLTGYATELYVDETVENLATQIPSIDGLATEDYVDDAIGGIVHPTYDDSGIKSDLSAETAARVAGDNTLQAEITELALALDTLLVQKTHGQWKYVGFMGDVMARNPGEFALGSDDLSASNNIIQLNNTDLNGLTVGMGDIGVGDYVELVDVGNPSNYVLFVVAGEPNGSGISEIPVTLKEKGNNFLVNAVCEIRFFELNDQSIDLSELDDRYARKDHTHPEFAEIDSELEQIKEDLTNLVPPPPEPPPSAEGDLEKAENGDLIMGYLKSVKASEITSGSKYESGPKMYFAWPDEIYNQNTTDKSPRKLSEISHLVLTERNGYVNTQSNGTLWYDQDFSETLNPGDFVRCDYISRSVAGYPSGKVDVTLVVGECVHTYTTSGTGKNYTFEVTEVTINPDSAEAVHYYSDTLNDNYLQPYNHLYINTHGKDYEAAYVTPEYLEEVIEDERAITDSELSSLQNQVDFMAQEMNHLIPLKEEGQWKAYSSAGGSGNMRFGKSSVYGPWDPGKQDRVDFNYFGKDGTDHTELLQGMAKGDKFECFISKDNYALFEVTRVSQYSSYTSMEVDLLKYEGAGYAMNDLLTFEFFDSEEKPRGMREQLYGYYHYIIAKTSDGINKNNLHEHPGRFICLDEDDNVLANQYSKHKKMLFCPVDADGNRAPCANDTSEYGSKQFRVWALTTCMLKDGDIVPSWTWNPKDPSEPFIYSSTKNGSDGQLIQIKFPEHDYQYMKMSDDLYFKWPI